MRLLLALASATTLHAQFYGLSTTDDGATLYFHTGRVLRGSRAQPANRIYRLSSGETKLFIDTEIGDHVSDATTSSDGSIVSYIRTTYSSDLVPHIISLPPGLNRPISTTVVLGPESQRREFPGLGYLSPNGRYLVLRRDDTVTRVDLASGATDTLPSGSIVTASPISNDGTVAAASDRSILLWNPQSQRSFDANARVQSASISANGDWVVYQITENYVWTLWSLETATGVSRAIATGDQNSYEPSLNAGGRTVLYLKGSPKQAWTSQIDGSQQRQLTSVEEEIAAVSVSDSGTTAYAASRWGRLFKFNLVTQDSEELFEPLPNITGPGQPRVPGSVATIRDVTGLTPAQLVGMTVTVNGKPVPLLASPTGQIRYQTPWDLDPLALPQPLVEITFPAPRNPFDASPSFRQPAGYYWPTFEDTEPRDQVWLPVHHPDGTRVTPEHPASPGEPVSVVMSGLGSVAPTVTTGVPGPVDPLSVTLNKIECNVGGSSQVALPAEVTYAGLAPFQIGIYQVNFTLPTAFDSTFEWNGHPYLAFACGIPGSAIPSPYEAIFIR